MIIYKWNVDKHHRCPECHTIVDTGDDPTWRGIYQCCRCGILFAKWPQFAARFRRFLPLLQCADIARGECPHQK